MAGNNQHCPYIQLCIPDCITFYINGDLLLPLLLHSTPDQCPHVVSLLSESFNPHVRCGSAMALGIACAGSGNKEALAIIEPMITDSVPFVQQVRGVVTLYHIL